jgi:hypothetical protein
VPVPSGNQRGKVIFLGETYEHSTLEESFTKWVKESKHLRQDSIYVEWVNQNPLEHSDENYAPVGNRMQFHQPSTLTVGHKFGIAFGWGNRGQTVFDICLMG